VSGASLVIDGTGTLDVRTIGSTTDLSALSFASTADVTVDAANQLSTSLGLGSNLTVTGSTQVDTITTNAGDDNVTGGAGNDVLNVKAGDNTVDGGAGNDDIDATTGNDTIFGGDGNDDIDVTGGDNVIDGGAGTDAIDTGAGDDTITGGEGADTITSGAGEDTIILTETTSAGDDVVFAQGDGSAVGVATGSFTSYNTITGFTSGTDDVDVTPNAAGAITIVDQDDAATATNDLADADFTDVDAIVAFLNDGGAALGGAAVEVDYVGVTFSNFSAIYVVDDAAGLGTVVAGEVELLARVDTVIAAGDII
jgi:Ca2+-binding RTX toxin-like protein